VGIPAGKNTESYRLMLDYRIPPGYPTAELLLLDKTLSV